MAPESKKIVQLTAHIYGRVQGVGYRAWAQRQAQSLQLTGWVQNMSDGSVALTAQGARATLEALVRSCWQGPRAASVDRIELAWQTNEVLINDFSIRRD